MTRWEASLTGNAHEPISGKPKWIVPVELGLGDANSGIEIVIGQGRVDDFVAVVLEVGRFHTARNRLPAVKEEDFHGTL